MRRGGVAAAASGPGRTSSLQEQEFVFLDNEGSPIKENARRLT